MTNLSPAAQAILKAAYKATRNPKWQTNFYSSYAAAALRAAAEQCAYKREIHPDSLIAEMIIEADDLLAIATELETFAVETDD